MKTAEELNQIFDTLKPILAQYSPPFSEKEPSEAIKKAGKRAYGLTSYKKVVIAGRERDEVYFAGLIIQKDYVGFYYMLAYDEPKILSQFSPEFVKKLKGKTCFYIRDTKPETLAEIKKALDIGLKEYKKRGWV